MGTFCNTCAPLLACMRPRGKVHRLLNVGPAQILAARDVNSQQLLLLHLRRAQGLRASKPPIIEAPFTHLCLDSLILPQGATTLANRDMMYEIFADILQSLQESIRSKEV